MLLRGISCAGAQLLFLDVCGHSVVGSAVVGSVSGLHSLQSKFAQDQKGHSGALNAKSPVRQTVCGVNAATE